jgi:hypothetical protein
LSTTAKRANGAASIASNQKTDKKNQCFKRKTTKRVAEIVYWQKPSEQVVPGGQTVPHVPQLLLSVMVLTQLPLQFVKPCRQMQVPSTQRSLAPHAIPHSPQLLMSVSST